MKKLTLSLLLLASAAVGANEKVMAPGATTTIDLSPQATEGRKIFLAQCARCHGNEGKGDGQDSKRVPVLPRNLTEGVFKFQSTAQGTPPSDEDLLWVLNHGMAGAGMPSFANLNLQTKEALIAYVKTMSPIFTSAKPEPLAAPSIKTRVDLQKGKEAFAKLQCALCHGDDGRANGPSAFTLKDAWQKPIRPANLTQGWSYRAGDSATQIYYRLMAGINGAPMPSYAEAVTSPEEAWQLANYVVSLQEKADWSPNVRVLKTNLDKGPSIDDTTWDQAEKAFVNMQGLLYKGNQRERMMINSVYVRSIQTKEGVSLRIDWNDPTQSEKSPADSLLVALQPSGFTGKGFDNFQNLYTKDSPPLDLIYWSAEHPSTIRQSMSTVPQAVNGEKVDHAWPSQASYKNGLWSVVFVRPFAVEGADTVTTDTKSLRIGFAAWDGGNDDSGLKRSASQWITLQFVESSTGH